MRNAWILVLAVGCGVGSDEPAMKIREGHAPAVGHSAKAPPINALEPYERLVRAFDQCALEGNQIVSTCPARRAFDTDMQGVSPEIRAKVGAQLIAHPSPAVRVQAASMVGFDVLARAATLERDPRVIEAFVRIAKDGAPNPAAAQLLLAAATHADSGVRLDAVDALANVEGGAAKLAILAETDPDLRVRRAACEQAGHAGTDTVLPFYERATAHVTDPDFYAACMEGLAVRVTQSEAAYRLFLRRIAETPRTENTPPWTVMSVFCDFKRDARMTWFDAAEVRRVLASVIADPQASMAARSAAIESLAGLGATPVELLTLKKSVTEKPLLDKIAAICE